ncbi:MAG: capsule assembly Wzi family protein [Rhodothalassiaceae bacterium]
MIDRSSRGGNLGAGLLGAVLFALVLALVARPLAAEPWVEPGDAQLRRDIELLAAFRVIDGPVISWPLSWAQISAGLAASGERVYPPHVEAAIARVKAHMPKAADYRRIGRELRGAVTSNAPLVRGFDAVAREDGEVSLSLDKHWSSTYVKATIGWRDDQVGNDIHYDNSYIAQAWGNWVFYAGTPEQWWGGGYDGGFLISTNARPLPRVGFQRLNPKPFQTKWLSWLGNWNIIVSLGRLEKNRGDFARPLLWETRLELSPIDGLDIGLSRTFILCGRTRQCTPGTFARAFTPFGRFDNTGTNNEPGDQIANVDLRYGGHWGGIAYAFFGTLIAEDKNPPIVSKYSGQLGMTLNGYSDAYALDWGLRIEASDSQAHSFFGLTTGPEKEPNVTFNHFLFTDGYTFRDRTIGFSLDTDSRLLTIEGTALDAGQRSYWLRYRHAIVNETNRKNVISANREGINIAEAGVALPTPYGDLRLELRAMDDRPNTPGRHKGRVEAEASIRFPF